MASVEVSHIKIIYQGPGLAENGGLVWLETSVGQRGKWLILPLLWETQAVLGWPAHLPDDVVYNYGVWRQQQVSESLRNFRKF